MTKIIDSLKKLLSKILLLRPEWRSTGQTPEEKTREYLEQFEYNYHYFSRYESTTIFGRAWWYAFGSSALFFFPTLGFMLDVITTLIPHLKTNFLVSALAGITGVVPLPWVIVALIGCSIFSLYLSYVNFTDVRSKCKKAYENEQELKELFCENQYRRQILQLNGIPLPDDLQAVTTPPVSRPYKNIMDKIKLIFSIALYNVFGSYGWLSTFAAFTGVNVFSTMPLVVGLPFLSPLILSVAFALLSLSAALWVSGIVDVKYNYHSDKQKWSISEINRQNQLLALAGKARLGENWTITTDSPEDNTRRLEKENFLTRYRILMELKKEKTENVGNRNLDAQQDDACPTDGLSLFRDATMLFRSASQSDLRPQAQPHQPSAPRPL